MGQAQSDEGELPRDDNGGAQTAAPAANEQKSNNQRAFKLATPRGNDSKQRARYKRNLLAAAATRVGGAEPPGSHDGSKLAQAEQQHVRKLSNVSNRNIQLLSMRPRDERDNFADGLRARRRSSLINLILGAPSRGPRFSDDLCSLSSHMSELCHFGIDYFPDTTQCNYQQQDYQHGRPVRRAGSSLSSRLEDNLGGVTLRPSSLALATKEGAHHYGASGNRWPRPDSSPPGGVGHKQHRRRSSFGSLSSFTGAGCVIGPASAKVDADEGQTSSSSQQRRQQSEGARECGQVVGGGRRPSLASIFMASIDLTGPLSVDQTVDDGETANANRARPRAPPLARAKQTLASDDSGSSRDSLKPTAAAPAATTNDCGRDERHYFGSRIPIAHTSARVAAAELAAARARINHNARRIIHRSGSELSLYSCTSAASLSHSQLHHQHQHQHQRRQLALARRTSSASPGGRAIVSRQASSTCDDCGAGSGQSAQRLRRETKWIIMLQVCLPFVLAGFGNMAAGLALNRMAQWEAFRRVPIFFVLLPSFVGLKGNIEMTLASRLSTLSNLGLLDGGPERRRAFATNLLLILGQAIGLSVFAALASVLCELGMGKLGELDPGELARLSALVVLPCALATSVALALVSSIVMWLAIKLAHRLHVNPDNLSTLVAALYGDVSCVLTYGLFAQLMYSHHQRGALVLPAAILAGALLGGPLLWCAAHKFKETRELSVASMPPMLAAIVVSLGSGAALSLVVGRFSRIALYQPVVNGFGANLIAVQASRVSTWLWCNALRRQLSSAPSSDRHKREFGFEFGFEPAAHKTAVPYGSLASFSTLSGNESVATKPQPRDISSAWPTDTSGGGGDGHSRQTAAERLKDGLAFAGKLVKLLLWSFCNSSPNAVAARLLLVMLIPAHSLYFVVIWALAPPGYVVPTWPFYLAYIGLCLTQVFVLLLICEPLMSCLMRRHLDPDIFGISLLMALADLIGTLCLTGAFFVLASLHDPNA